MPHGGMTAHEIARALLAGPDLPVMLSIANGKDTAYTNCEITVGTNEQNHRGVGGPTEVSIRGWVSSDDDPEDSFAPWADYEED